MVYSINEIYHPFADKPKARAYSKDLSSYCGRYNCHNLWCMRNSHHMQSIIDQTSYDCLSWVKDLFRICLFFMLNFYEDLTFLVYGRRLLEETEDEVCYLIMQHGSYSCSYCCWIFSIFSKRKSGVDDFNLTQVDGHITSRILDIFDKQLLSKIRAF